MLLNHEFIIKGRWFCQEENQVHGELKFNPESGTELTIFGSFIEFRTRMEMDNHQIEFIYGNSSNGKLLTLYNCSLIGSTYNGGTHYEECIYRVNIAFKGHHLLKDHLQFNSFKFRLKNLDTWFYLNGINYDPTNKSEFSLSYNKPQSKKVELNSCIFEIFGGYNSRVQYAEANFSEYASIGFTTNKSFSIEEVFQHIGKVKGFLAMMTYEPTFLVSLKLYNNDILYEQPFRKEKPKVIDVIWRDISFYHSDKDLSVHKMILRYTQIQDNLSVVLRKWYKYHDEISPSFNLLFYSFRKSLIFTEEFFMDMARAVEVWHRRIIDSQLMMPTDFEKFVIKALANETLNEDQKQILQGALAFANEPNLKQRLSDLFREYGFIFNFNDKERTTFIKNVANSRNYYTHYDERRKATAVKDIELYDLAINLRALLISAILIKVGVDKTLIKQRMNDILAQWK